MSHSNTTNTKTKPNSIIFFSDHSVKATFDDGTILLLNCDGTEMYIARKPETRSITTVLSSDVQQFKTQFLLSEHFPLLNPVLAFRNMYTSIPYFVKQLSPSSKIFQVRDHLLDFNQQTNSQIRFSHWSLPKNILPSSVCFHSDDQVGLVTVVSSDQLVQVTLSRHLQSFQVQYPALVSQSDMKWKVLLV